MDLTEVTHNFIYYYNVNNDNNIIRKVNIILNPINVNNYYKPLPLAITRWIYNIRFGIDNTDNINCDLDNGILSQNSKHYIIYVPLKNFYWNKINASYAKEFESIKNDIQIGLSKYYKLDYNKYNIFYFKKSKTPEIIFRIILTNSKKNFIKNKKHWFTIDELISIADGSYFNNFNNFNNFNKFNNCEKLNSNSNNCGN